MIETIRAMEKLNGVSIERVGSGEPLLLIHGTGGTRFHWTPVVGPLAEQRELLLVDLPGHGESDPPPVGVPHTPIGYAAILADTLDELGTPLPDVAGNSVGGWTALELAKLDAPARSSRSDPPGSGPTGTRGSAPSSSGPSTSWVALFARITPRVMRSDLGRTLAMGGTVAQPKSMPAEAAIEIASAYAKTPTFDAHFAETRKTRFRDGREIDVPVTIAWGDEERLLPAKARRENELPPHTRTVTLPRCGHIAMWDEPELVGAGDSRRRCPGGRITAQAAASSSRAWRLAVSSSRSAAEHAHDLGDELVAVDPLDRRLRALRPRTP